MTRRTLSSSSRQSPPTDASPASPQATVSQSRTRSRSTATAASTSTTTNAVAKAEASEAPEAEAPEASEASEASEAPETTAPIAPTEHTTSASSASPTSKHLLTLSAPSTSLTSTEPYTRHNAPQRSNVKPRWHTQPYMMFLALRSMPNHTAARQELINAAVALDRKFSAEKGLPRVFTGKTPMNSASACLTNNGDKYFIPFKPEGSKSTHFRLAYAPGDFDTAVKEYDGWMEKLIKHDWPLCFGTPKEGAVPIHILEQREQAQRAIEQEAAEALGGPSTLTETTLSDGLVTASGVESCTTSVTSEPVQNAVISNDHYPSEAKKRSSEPIDDESEADVRRFKKVKTELDLVEASGLEIGQTSLAQSQGQDQNRDHDRSHESNVTDKMKQLKLKSTSNTTSSPPPAPGDLVSHESEVAPSAFAAASVIVANSSSPLSTTSAGTAKTAEASTPQPDSQRVDEYRLEDLDLSRVPTSLADVVRVDASTVPNSGNGLFTKIDIPASTPLGFYFGVPMTEYEFDSLKDGVGIASHYSIMYRRTVLDATDENGMPYSDPNGRLYCPFHFMNEDPSGNITFITGSVVNQVICQTNRDVKAGEELFVFYGKEVDRFWEKESSSSDAGRDQTKGRAGSQSRTTSPARREDPLTDRPRRNNVHKPARYTR